MHKLTYAFENPRTLSQAVIQATQLLNLLQAELARILGLHCGDIGELASGRQMLIEDTRAWERACLFITFYNLLFDRMEGNGVAMRHWLRAENKTLGSAPYLLFVDADRLEQVTRHLRSNLG